MPHGSHRYTVQIDRQRAPTVRIDRCQPLAPTCASESQESRWGTPQKPIVLERGPRMARCASGVRSAKPLKSVPRVQTCPGQTIAHIRVSSTNQNPDRQIDKVCDVEETFTDEVSGKSRAERPGLYCRHAHPALMHEEPNIVGSPTATLWPPHLRIFLHDGYAHCLKS